MSLLLPESFQVILPEVHASVDIAGNKNITKLLPELLPI